MKVEDEDSMTVLETAMRHISNFGIALFFIMGIFCLVSSFILLILQASTILVLAPATISLGYFYLALNLFQRNSKGSSHSYNLNIEGSNYGDIQQGGKNNYQNTYISNKTDK